MSAGQTPPLTPPAELKISRYGGNAKVKQLLDTVDGGDWRVAETILAPMRDWNQKSFLISCLADIDGRPSWLDQWVDNEPRSATAWTTRGCHSIHWAWEARGGGTSDQVEGDAWDVFFERLHAAENDLYQAIKLAPADPLPWSYLIITANGLQLHILDARERLDEALRLDPTNFRARRFFIDPASKKWGGSHELMFSFVREQSAAAPDGSPIHGLIADAWVERWLWEADFEGQEHQARQLLQEAQPELRAAAERSVFSPAWRQSLITRSFLQSFAFCFWLGGDQRRTLALLQRIGGYIDLLPWAYPTKKAFESYSQAWKDCLR